MIKRTLLCAGIILLVIIALVASGSPERVGAMLDTALDDDPAVGACPPGLFLKWQALDVSIRVEGMVPPGALGLPGEPVIWVITVENTGSVPLGDDLIVTNVLRDELRIDSVEVSRGDFAISGQMVVFTLGHLAPGETAEMHINTTVMRGPVNGILTHQATLSTLDGAAVQSAFAEIFVPTGLPATGYPPETDLPGTGEPSVFVVALLAFSVVALTAGFVWHRGSQL